jgi:ABC-type antimicrobial peptide transport system permease subunit
MAIGAQSRDVRWLVLREVALLVGMGLAIGLPASLGSSRLIASQLFNLTPADPATLAGAVIILIFVAGVAGYIPARRASREDPMVALRHE